MSTVLEMLYETLGDRHPPRTSSTGNGDPEEPKFSRADYESAADDDDVTPGGGEHDESDPEPAA